jgi:AcrR family transcriptional regulator
VIPQRARGRARVEAILDAATELFAERGYDQATMTEIAARSDTAIGSLYRFFPTKELLGETLLRRYLERSAAAISELLARASQLGADELADALFDKLIHRDPGRQGALAVAEAHSEGLSLRREFRARLRSQVAAILQAANPRLSDERAQDRAIVLVAAAKGMSRLGREEPRLSTRSRDEQRRLLRLYIADALKERSA